MATLRDALEQAVALHRAGQLDPASELYGRILANDPDQPDALNLLGALHSQRGQHALALAHLERAVARRPEAAEFHSNLAAVLIHLGRFAEAQACAEQALTLDADCLDGELNRAKALGAQGNLEGAAAAYARALALDPHHAAALHARGRILERQQRFSLALGYFEQAAAAGPAPRVSLELGNAFGRFGRLEQAAACYQQAIEAAPDLAAAHYGLGIVRGSQARHAEALASYQRAVGISPLEARFHSACGDALRDNQRFEEATASYGRALELDPRCFEARNHLGTLYELQGRAEEAKTCYAQALALRPSNAVRFKLATMLPVVYASGDELHRTRRQLVEGLDRLTADGVTLDPAKDILPPSFYLAYQGEDDLAIHRKIAALCSASSRDFTRGRGGRRREDRRIQIGFVSSLLKHHTIGKLYRGLIAELSRERFVVTLVSLGTAQDEMARWIRERADRVVELPIRPAGARRRLAEEQLDVLFYPDVGMHPTAYALAHSRLAPVQCVSWGHPVTTGLPSMDYFVSSRLLEPDGARAHYSEELVLLETLPVYYYRPGPLPEAPRGREAFGLAESEHVYLCPQSLFKLHPDFDAALGAILRGDRDARLVLIEGLHPEWGATLRRRFATTLQDVAERILFLPRLGERAFLELLALSDVMLDPWHFGGGNSSYEAFAMGTPIVTLPGASLRGRVTLGCYRKMQLMDAVAADRDDYIERALRLGSDPHARDALAARIHRASPVLFEDEGALRALEGFLADAFARTGP